MSDPARDETLAALATLRERLLQAVVALDAAQAALVAEAGAAPDAAWSGAEVAPRAPEATPRAPEAMPPAEEVAPPADDAPPAADGPSVADLTRRFEAIRAQLAELGVRAAGDPDVTPPT